MDSITVVGDGAVGTAVAVALSEEFHVILAGPPGIRSQVKRFFVSGALSGSAKLLHMPIDRVHRRSLVIAALKSFDISGAVPFISQFSHGHPICLSNGSGLNREWGNSAPGVEYAVLTAGFSKSSDVSVAVTQGEIYCAADGNCSRLFRNNFLPVHTVENIDDIRWAKWYTNSIINPLGALTGLPNNLVQSSELGHLIQKLEKEFITLAPSEDALRLGREMLRWILEHSFNRCSMLQDISCGRKTEIDHLTAIAAEHSPTAKMLTELVKART